MTVEELAKEIEKLDKEFANDIANHLLLLFRIERIDPMKQCYAQEGNCSCHIPDTCVIDDGNPYGCRIASKLFDEGKTREDCQYWGKK